ncbi:Lactate dehydrogenase [Nakamurella panacisegetis]|uniref:Lactate dehydrogenase n=1 Tax=Nakamurella panacisegetis TaxID=1090615 RepID=A0A1H0QT92_9ACTN|nr:D-2-hydroxyacid dehydrogenase family protein [Nakamurella panacisegetis]SDP20335.1 Lactate dehydrogenase [Nakamurella panacisegetis]
MPADRPPRSRVAVLDDYQQVAARFADWAGLDADVTFFDRPIAQSDLPAALGEFDVIVAMRERTPFPATVLRQLPRLRLLVTTGARNASIDLKATAALGITVCATGYLPSPAAEHTWALILAAARRLPTEFAAVAAGGWQQTVGMGLAGHTLGLAGLGRLGSAVARVGLAFGMNVIAWSQHLTVERAAEVGVAAVSKEQLLTDSDVLSIHLVLSARSRGLFGAGELALMKPSAILVNTSRGPIVDEPALLDVLRRNAIRGAALDVFDIEPLPVDHPFRTLPSVVMTPHLGYVVDDQYRIFYADAVEDIARFAAGSPVRVLAL